MKIGLFIPCYINLYYPQTGIATVELLEKLGHEVIYPDSQTCCGQPLANAGYASSAQEGNVKFLRAFQNIDTVVAPSGSCIMHIRQHVEESSRFLELSEFILRDQGLEKIQGRYPHTVGIHASCHGLRGLRLGAASELRVPQFNNIHAILARLEGIRIASLSRADECCGFGGTFAVNEAAVSVSMGTDRLFDHIDHGVEVVTASDMSCLMHLEGIAGRKGLNLKFRHYAEILNEAIS